MQAVNMKANINIVIYLLASFQFFSEYPSYFPILIFFLCIWKNVKQISGFNSFPNGSDPQT
jgi:hypothetical protein